MTGVKGYGQGLVWLGLGLLAPAIVTITIVFLEKSLLIDISYLPRMFLL